MRVLCALALLTLASVQAKMMAPPPTVEVPVDKLLSQYDELERDQKLTPAKAAERTLLRTAKAGGIKSIALPVQYSVISLHSQLIVDWLARSIRRSPRWEQVTESSARELKSKRQELEPAVGTGNYLWAWIEYQMGEKSEAKVTLSNLFEKETARLLQLKKVVFGFRGGPLDDVEAVFNALEPMSTADAKATLQSKMQKVKIHISNLPQSHIVT